MGHHAYYDCKIIDLLCLSSAFGYLGLAVGIVIGVVTWYSWQKNLKDSAKTTLPPSSLGLPFLGETLSFFVLIKPINLWRILSTLVWPNMDRFVIYLSYTSLQKSFL